MTDDDIRALVERLRPFSFAAHQQVADAIESLLAERDALRADAERYRWLRDGDWDAESHPDVYSSVRDARTDQLDAAIDAARGASDE